MGAHRLAPLQGPAPSYGHVLGNPVTARAGLSGLHEVSFPLGIALFKDHATVSRCDMREFGCLLPGAMRYAHRATTVMRGRVW